MNLTFSESAVVCSENKKCTAGGGKCQAEPCSDSEEEIKNACGTDSCSCCAKECIPDDSCKNAGGFCVRRKKDCPTTLDSKSCTGKKCKCCLPGKYN